MSILLSNCHTHSVYSDGKSTLSEIVEEAVRLGLVSLGLSEHGMQCNNRFNVKSETAYADEIDRLREQYGDRIRLWTGIEADYWGYMRINYDYVLGSVHYPSPITCGKWSIDHNKETFLQTVKEGYGGDMNAFIASYFQKVVKMADLQKPQIIAHFDLISKFNKDRDLFPTDDGSFFIKKGLEALDALCGKDLLLEVNTGGMSRGYMTEPYPYVTLLKYWQSRGEKVIFGSDSHHKDTLIYAFDETLELIRSCGFHELWRLGTKDELFEADIIK